MSHREASDSHLSQGDETSPQWTSRESRLNMKHRAEHIWMPLAFVALVAIGFGCEHSEEPDAADMEPTLTNVQSQVFDECCATAGCHNDETQAANLNLSDADVSYQALVERPSENSVAREGRWMLVKPGEPERSFLIRKIEQPGVGEGAAMPVGNKALNGPYLDMVRAWIEAGAQR